MINLLILALFVLFLFIFFGYMYYSTTQYKMLLLSQKNDSTTREMFKRKAWHCLRNNIPFTVLIVDFDSFKNIANTVGYTERQYIIKEMHHRMQSINTNCFFDGLFRDKEYVSIITHKNIEEINHLTHAMLMAFNEVFYTKSYSISLTASIGWCSSTGYDESPSMFLKKADIALAEAKNHGGNMVVKFEEFMLQVLNRKLNIMKDIRRGLEADEFFPWFQPRVSIEQVGDEKFVKVTSVESLARWEKEDGEIIYPGEFIQTAEDCGLILDLGYMILLKTCIQIRKWEHKYGEDTPKVSVNVSPKQFVANFPEVLRNVINITKINPQHLEIEITESSMFSDVQKVKDALQEISMMGIHIAVDDFGSGYSSFSYLKELPIDIIKIDASITRSLNQNSEYVIMESIIDIADKLGFNIVIEGVETSEELQALMRLKVFSHIKKAEIQGYFFAKPMPTKSFEQWFETSLNKQLQ